MATLYKKLVKKVKPKTKKTPEKPPEKVGKDYWLLAILFLTTFFLGFSWFEFDNINRALYISLIVSLISAYIRRHATTLSDKQTLIVEQVGFWSMIAAITLFIVKVYQKFIA